MATIAQFRQVLKGQVGVSKTEILEVCGGRSIEDACRVHGHRWRHRFWTPLQTFWTFLWQVLHFQSSCREAVAAALAEHAVNGRGTLPSQDASAYCQARGRLPLAALQESVCRMGQRLRQEVGQAITWCGRQVWLVDGTTCSMPDTPELQAAFGQPTGQRRGCGFPVAKVVAMFCWASGAVLEAAIGPLFMSELRLWRTLWHLLSPGQIVLGDRFYSGFCDIVGVLRRNCDAVFRLHQRRKQDFRRGKRLGEQDRLVIWQRPKRIDRPNGMTRREWKSLPETLTIRLIRFVVDVPGFRAEKIAVATTLLDAVAYPAANIAALYRDRWLIELRFRDIKTTMGMEILRCKTPDMVLKEVYMHLLAYNLVRTLMWQAAAQHGRPLHRLSFAGTVDRLNVLEPYLFIYEGTDRAEHLYALMLAWIAKDQVPHRPNRFEPRAVKRRPKEYPRLNWPRQHVRKGLLCA
jgi:hypothetical protein